MFSIIEFLRHRTALVSQMVSNVVVSLWFRPALWMVGLTLAAVALVLGDGYLSYKGWHEKLPDLFLASADGTRGMLTAIATATLTASTLSFSSILVSAVQISNAYSPRFLRRMLGDRGVQNRVGVMLGTYLFSLVALRSTRGFGEEYAVFVPHVTANLAFLLSLVSTGAMVSFISYTARSLKVGYIVDRVVEQSQSEIDHLFPSTLGTPWIGDDDPELPKAEPLILTSARSGYLQRFDDDGLLEEVRQRGLIVVFHYTLGEYVVENTPLMHFWGAHEIDDEMAETLRTTCVIGQERTWNQDVSFGLEQLADVALRGLSPGINDPRTAMNALDAIAVPAREVGQARLALHRAL